MFDTTISAFVEHQPRAFIEKSSYPHDPMRHTSKK
jgi:hypothetical protein